MNKQANSDKTSGVDQFDVAAVNAANNRPALYAPREKIFPKRASGFFRQLKWVIMIITLGIYYLTPWLRFDRGEFAPDQAVLVDLANRRFYFFFIEIWPQEFYYVAGLLVMAGVGLFLVTSTVGRAWCGYACPQTVWVDLFLLVERFFEGDRNQRIKLDKGPYDFNKVWRRLAKHSSWILIAVATGGAWIFYFADAPTLALDVIRFEAPAIAYFTILILTATTYIFGGFMREQVCTYMCPWPRIQGAMLDEFSLTVTYNDWRGEPRNKHTKKAIKEGKPVGDCVDCNACVVVCPMGIDIRDGQQLECITCALCIDACDNVMDKLGKERGLISYATLNDYNTNMELAMDEANIIRPDRLRDKAGKFVDAIKHTSLQTIVRWRTLIYFGVWAAIGLAMLVVLSMRDRLDVNVQHDRNPLFVVLSDGAVRNGYDVKILNMTPEPRTMKLTIVGLPGGEMTLASSQNEPQQSIVLDVEPDRVLPLRVYVRTDPKLLTEQPTKFTFLVEDIFGDESSQELVKFETPKVGE
ncbi:cytochrome c oxidase accessory protein CcoG [Maritalea porphyrae]|jgi:cytochrome c oxidase accessory protein FixG|uniref:cytochrome c oxidase accessory protein CcoG n=1 Tax=Maritalea porphyrae TaxID=880732 RepID=UPI0022B04763|nr:cytochrome c oxidase accessory protein CcoG [Maritalea porphyrae]MCZ4272359.1 cytochrome c oxidase accessory protein CcoG [Maritalea porphyrae]